jgi:UDP-2-acetamido-2-deoxy-ribo-hexuluronate aminotransferase
MKFGFIDLQAQYRAYKTEIDQAMAEVVDSAYFIMGPQVAALEHDLQAYTGAPHAIGCANGTDALMLAMMAIDIKPGDEVITTPFTFIATGEMIAILGAVPVFVDIEPDTFNIDATKIEEKITSRTKAIIPVSLYGQPADMAAINAIAEKHQLHVIEDAAQSFGAEYQGKKSCNLSTLATTSFFPAKPLGCFGDGGAVFTSDEQLAEKMKILRVHGQNKRYHHRYIGMNGRLDTLQAAVLQVKLKHFPEEVRARHALAARYNALFADMDLVTPVVKEGRSSVYAQYTLRVQQRDAFCAALAEEGIPTAVHYPMPLHLQACFGYLNYSAGDFPVAELAAKEVVSLPMSAFLTHEQQDWVKAAIVKAGVIG